ncbi:MAG: hypothetical protein ABR913_00805 [Sedimentisphaerales bacterium]|jgi:hypothetical protein
MNKTLNHQSAIVNHKSEISNHPIQQENSVFSVQRVAYSPSTSLMTGGRFKLTKRLWRKVGDSYIKLKILIFKCGFDILLAIRHSNVAEQEFAR